MNTASPRRTISAVAVTAGLVGFTATALFGFAPTRIPGTLEPPSGAVDDTTPSLAELEDKIDALAIGSSGGPIWESYELGPLGVGGPGVVSASSPVIPGRVIVRKVSCFRASIALFETPATITSDTGLILSPSPTPKIHLTSQLVVTGQANVRWEVTQDLETNLVFENGVYLTYALNVAGGRIQILYERLD